MKLLDRLKKMKLGKNTLWFTLMLAVGVGMFYLLAFVFTPAGAFSMFPAAILLMYIGISFLLYMDKVHHAEIDTALAIKENNISYALILLAYAIIIAAVLSKI